MIATVFRESYMTRRPSLFTLISYCTNVFSFALIFANGWFTACAGFYGASACWLSHMKQWTITTETYPITKPKEKKSWGDMAYYVTPVWKSGVTRPPCPPPNCAMSVILKSLQYNQRTCDYSKTIFTILLCFVQLYCPSWTENKMLSWFIINENLVYIKHSRVLYWQFLRLKKSEFCALFTWKTT